ncbi:MAG: hypothetical protein IJU75_04075 [Clostridia bacterium]|nr:hypothetical protein [Clostridia bacterium]
MKKFIIIVIAVILLFLAGHTIYYEFGIHFNFGKNQPVTTFAKTDGKTILLDRGNGYEPLEIRGVNMGSGEPGKWSTDYAIDYETYYRWFGMMQEMGANTLRIYSVQEDTFYNAFFDYNRDREKQEKEPLWLLHGVWVNDYTQFSHLDMYTEEFLETLINDSKTMVDVIHGQRDLNMGRLAASGSGSYRKDVSRWVLGYILGVEWEPETVIYTDQIRADEPRYQGKYMYASDDATPFESALARVGDEVISYETDRYHVQRLTAFSNWPTTDPFKYSTAVTAFWNKLAAVNVEHIHTTEEFISGSFASYHVYPYYPDYLESATKETDLTPQQLHEMYSFSGFLKLDWRVKRWNVPSVTDYLREEDYTDRYGRFNTYLAYLTALNRYHTMPVVISEFGVSTGRGMAQIDENTGRNQGHMSENGQGQAIIECYEDIVDSGCAGCCVFSWQDEWFKRTWNTMHAVDLRRTPYWSDYQTNEQYFGLISFDPGKETSVCYVDGDVSEWDEKDIVGKNGDLTLSMKYDERFLYFMIEKPGFDLEKDTLYLPIDTTPKSGSNYCENFRLQFDCDADFLLVLRGKENSRLMVQERYEVLRSTYALPVYGFNTYVKSNMPDADSPLFRPIDMILKVDSRFYVSAKEQDNAAAMCFETGKLEYGNANPESAEFNSLADFMSRGDYVEVKLPWQLLNFSDPSRMSIHDDYYEYYGIEYISIDFMEVGVSDGADGHRIPTTAVSLNGWGNRVTYHERPKRSYYILKDYWTAR